VLLNRVLSASSASWVDELYFTVHKELKRQCAEAVTPTGWPSPANVKMIQSR